jgi:hypothetical protein
MSYAGKPKESEKKIEKSQKDEQRKLKLAKALATHADPMLEDDAE